MILRVTAIALIGLLTDALAEFCGNNRIPFGIEECPERAEEKSCTSNTSWVGGLQKTIDGQLLLQCCEYPLMEKYGQLMFTNVGENF
ncbi:unnamed protein product [Strongylus vulgaris]|uniref:Uncharacterized protein n=1 Tax=Strongylus vulgaris TaxID=40348 RepID=A0A3P7JG47_STRVU|nr:unnamed protein product [Strongylus vulgaris]